MHIKDLQISVLTARARQRARFMQTSHATNHDVTSAEIQQFFSIRTDAENFLHSAAEKMKLTTRGYFGTIKIGQTIADLAESKYIEKEHIAEALQYR